MEKEPDIRLPFFVIRDFVIRYFPPRDFVIRCSWRKHYYIGGVQPRPPYNPSVQFIAADPAAATADYRRQARRIRASFNHNPLLRQLALSDLATRRNAELEMATETPDAPAQEYTLASVVERSFAEHASAKLQPFGFLFSDRVRLLDAAEQLGITRFRANMILAMQEHQAPARRFAAPEVPGKSFAPSLVVILSLELVVVGVLIALCAL